MTTDTEANARTDSGRRRNRSSWLKNITAANRRNEGWRKSLPIMLAALAAPGVKERRAMSCSKSQKIKDANRAMLKDGRIHRLAAIGRAQSPLCKKGVENSNAKWWSIRSPMNRVFEFRNLAEFI